MPRGPRKTQSGVPSQPTTPVAEQTYGSGQPQQALARTLPTPDLQRPTGPGGAGGAPQPVGQPPPPDPQAEFGAALAQAGGLGGMAGMLGNPTQRPGEPLTAGLSTGPGPGPEVLGRRGNPTGDLLRRISLETGDPTWAEMAARVRM